MTNISYLDEVFVNDFCLLQSYLSNDVQMPYKLHMYDQNILMPY